MAADASRVHAIGDAYLVVETGDGRDVRCAKCDFSFGSPQSDPKLNALVAERPITASSELNRHGLVDELVLREFYCPGCGAMLGANIQRRGDPVLLEMQLD